MSEHDDSDRLPPPQTLRDVLTHCVINGLREPARSEVLGMLIARGILEHGKTLDGLTFASLETLDTGDEAVTLGDAATIAERLEDAVRHARGQL